jgi:hypothetical protein
MRVCICWAECSAVQYQNNVYYIILSSLFYISVLSLSVYCYYTFYLLSVSFHYRAMQSILPSLFLYVGKRRWAEQAADNGGTMQTVRFGDGRRQGGGSGLDAGHSAVRRKENLAW